MSPSIKPPTGAAPGLSGIEGTADIKPAAPGDSSAVSAANTHAATSTGAGESASTQLLRQLEAGEVSRQQAIEGLVAQALEAHGGARLPAPQRMELEQVLRAALLDDPVLSRLIGSD